MIIALQDFIAIYSFPLELLVALVLYLFSMVHKDHFPLRLSFSSAAYLLVTAVLTVLGMEFFAYSVGYAVFCILVSLCGVCVVLFCTNWPFIDAVRCVAYAYTTQHMTYCIHCLICHIDNPAALSRYSIWYLLIYAACYCTAYFFFAKQITAPKEYELDARSSLVSSLVTLGITLGFSSIAQNFRSESPSLYAVTQLYAIFCCFGLLYFQRHQTLLLMYQYKLTLQDMLWAERKSQFNLSRENVALINQKCHDLKHQINALRFLPENKEREDRLNEIEKSVMIYDSVVETGNDAIDTVLTEKSLICERNRITFTCMADGKCLDFIDVIDLYTIFGNILDNAIECCSQLERPEQRIISISIFSKANLVFIQCENYYEHEIIFKNGLPVSTKAANGYHGFGINGIRQTAEKYNGILSLETDDHIFLLRIMFPLDN